LEPVQLVVVDRLVELVNVAAELLGAQLTVVAVVDPVLVVLQLLREGVMDFPS